jgi:hypothetical protein
MIHSSASVGLVDGYTASFAMLRVRIVLPVGIRPSAAPAAAMGIGESLHEEL